MFSSIRPSFPQDLLNLASQSVADAENDMLIRILHDLEIEMVPKSMPYQNDRFLYKVILKISANQMKVILSGIISPIQTALIQGCWINKNAILASTQSNSHNE